MITVGPYNVLNAYKNRLTWTVVERSTSSIRDRVLYYCLAFLALTSALICFLFKLRRNNKANTLIFSESLRERLLRYADPIKYMNAADSLKVTAARDISEKLLDTSIDDFQVEEIADELREKLGINLITEQEKSYLIDLCKSFIKKGKKQLDTQKLVNNLFVLIADTSKVGGKDYTEIQRTIAQISDLNKR